MKCYSSVEDDELHDVGELIIRRIESGQYRLVIKLGVVPDTFEICDESGFCLEIIKIEER
jgi:hypothetical protein